METNTITSATAQISQIKEKGIEFLYQRGPNLLGAIIILVAGYMVARFLCRLMGKWLEKRHLEPPVRMLLMRLLWLVIMALFVMVALGTLGIAVGPLIALMSVAGVGVGLAMQGVLSNLVAGLLIIFTKPFRVGEYVEIIGCTGQVSTIDMFTTVLLHPDRSRVVIPNRKIVGEVLHNYGAIRQLSLAVGVAYDTDIGAALAVVEDVLSRNPRVLQEPAPLVRVSALSESSVDIAVLPWVEIPDYGAAAGELNRAILEALRDKGIVIPFPQREVRLLGDCPAQEDADRGSPGRRNRT